MPKTHFYYLTALSAKDSKASTTVFKSLDDYRYILRVNAYLRRVMHHVKQCQTTIKNATIADFIGGRMNDVILTLLQYHLLSIKLSFELPNSDVNNINGTLFLSKFDGTRDERKTLVFNQITNDKVHFVTEDFIKKIKRILPRNVLFYKNIELVNLNLVNYNPGDSVSLKDIGPKKTRFHIKYPMRVRTELGKKFQRNQSDAAYYFGNAGQMHRSIISAHRWYSDEKKYAGITPRDVDIRGTFALGIEEGNDIQNITLSVSIPTNIECEKTTDCLEKISILQKLTGRVSVSQKIKLIFETLGIKKEGME